MAELKRSTGIVRWFSAQKGFGFIAPDDAGQDLFVHQTSIRSDGFRTLFDDQPVEFSIDFDDNQRPKAVDVTLIDGSTARVRGAATARGSPTARGRPRGYGRFDGSGGRGFGRGGRYDAPTGGARGGGGGECYNCGQMGHLARDCYRDNSGGAPPARGRGRGYGGGRGYGRGYGGDRGYGNSGGGGGGRGGCYNCGDTGHFARDCQNES